MQLQEVRPDLNSFKTWWEASPHPISEISWEQHDMRKWILISVRPIQHHWWEVRVRGISPVHGKLKFRGAKDTEIFFMHKSISDWLSEMHHTCRFCLNACCQQPRRLHFAWFTHSTLVMQILSFSPSLPVRLICSSSARRANNGPATR